MRREDRIKYSEQAVQHLVGRSRPNWTEDDQQTYYAIDEAVVAALKEQRRQIAAYLREQGQAWLADQVLSGKG